MTQLAPPREILTGPPRVRLLAYTEKAYDIAIASARTCYAPTLKTVDEVNDKLREGLGKAIYNAGHHTPFQHPTFVFSLEQVSRQFVWSFLHSHPFYNSEQQSQRYVVMDQAAVHVPEGLDKKAREVFEGAVREAWGAYDRISELLQEDVHRTMHAIGKIKGQSDKKIASEAQKKSIETARYVIPVAAFTSLYHTISGIELKRYARMAETGDCPAETVQVVEAMLEAVREVDPDFVDRIREEPMPRSQVVESQVEQAANASRPGEASNGDDWVRAFDASLDGREANLVAFDEEAEHRVAQAVRDVLGIAPERLSDDEAIRVVMDPAKNPHHHDTLNAWAHSPVMRALNHAVYTFNKRMSHTADSQEQRHRTVPGNRPLLSRVHTTFPDYYTPEILLKNEEATRAYHETMKTLWNAKNRLIEMGVPAEKAVYLLPNAVNVRYTTTGSLLNYLHKWRLRTCFNAQREIYDHAMQELLQARQVHPRLGAFIGPPCLLRVHDKSSWQPLEGPCPEGKQWCGIKVWNNFPDVKRPF
jgi:flavin-dependent thymidylate synthase